MNIVPSKLKLRTKDTYRDDSVWQAEMKEVKRQVIKRVRVVILHRASNGVIKDEEEEKSP